MTPKALEVARKTRSSVNMQFLQLVLYSLVQDGIFRHAVADHRGRHGLENLRADLDGSGDEQLLSHACFLVSGNRAAVMLRWKLAEAVNAVKTERVDSSESGRSGGMTAQASCPDFC